MTETGSSGAADHRPVTGRPGVQAENTEHKRRTGHLSYSGRFFQSCVNPLLAAVRIRTGGGGGSGPAAAHTIVLPSLRKADVSTL